MTIRSFSLYRVWSGIIGKESDPYMDPFPDYRFTGHRAPVSRIKRKIVKAINPLNNYMTTSHLSQS